MKLVRERRLLQADVAEHWGSVSWSVLSLFIMGSVNVAFPIHVAFMILVITILVTGVYVDRAQRLVSIE